MVLKSFLQTFSQYASFAFVSDSQHQSFSVELTLTLALGWELWLALKLAWGHFLDIKFLIYTSLKDFSLDIYDNTHLLHLVSDSQRLSFSQELTPTLTLGLSLGLGLELAWGHFQKKYFSSTEDLKIFPWTSTKILIFCIWFQILNAYRFPRS